MKQRIFPVFLFLFSLFLLPGFLLAKEPSLSIDFFYSETCPHCRAEQGFLDALEKEYPHVPINRHLAADPQYRSLLEALLKKHEAEQYLGLVPLTFIGEDLFIGFDNAQGTGKAIKESLERQLKQDAPREKPHHTVVLPLLGQQDLSQFSLPVLAVVLGTLDGFNVCSLGALVLILALTLALRKRKRVFLFGGIFVLTTAFMYGLLIFLWHQFFSLVAPYTKILELGIAMLGLAGGIYFFKEFLRLKKEGPTCEAGSSKLVSRLAKNIQGVLENPRNMLLAAGAVLLFAGAIAVIEFPCSAVLPVLFAGILAEAHLSLFVSFLYLSLFLFFYLLDEIIVLLIAGFRMTLWLASPKFVTFATLLQALLLLGIGLYYLLGVLGV